MGKERLKINEKPLWHVDQLYDHIWLFLMSISGVK